MIKTGYSAHAAIMPILRPVIGYSKSTKLTADHYSPTGVPSAQMLLLDDHYAIKNAILTTFKQPLLYRPVEKYHDWDISFPYQLAVGIAGNRSYYFIIR